MRMLVSSTKLTVHLFLWASTVSTAGSLRLSLCIDDAKNSDDERSLV